ncbi:MAG: hypothetical protein QOE60_2378 [Thermoleophilaceae bacterium]|jgi:uncharacterized glyoxalase superfamily protein PhnB|nr:hypothetical protein [Thermoleophilaceae bacterium]
MQRIYPVLRYSDAHAAIDFLERAFGFQRHAVHESEDGAIVHAELRYGDQIVMLGPGESDTTVYIAVDAVDALHDTAKAAGADIVTPLTDQDYGSRDFSARDPEGNVWSFGTYRPEISG